MNEKRVPMYQQIKKAIYREVNNGNWLPGQRVMTEEELARKFEVSRMTARHALVELEREGVVVRYRALGTYVAANRIHRVLDRLFSFGEMLQDHGMEPEIRINDFVVLPADGTLAGILGTQPRELLVKTEQLQLANQAPISILELWMIQTMCPGITAEDFARSNYYDFLREQYKIEIKYANLTIEAAAANYKQARQLQVARGFPLLQVGRVSYDQYSRPVSYSKAVHRSDKYLIQETVRR